MKLSQAIHYGSYPGAVTCVRTPVKAFAHVCRQGGYGVHEWWTVSMSPVRRNPIEPAVWSYDVKASETMSFGTIDGCYTWLRDHHVSPFVGWYPTQGYQKWWQLGEIAKERNRRDRYR